MKEIFVLHIIKNLQIGGAEILIKSIINANEDHVIRHKIIYTDAGPLFNLINESKKSDLLFCRNENPFIFILGLRQIIKFSKAELIHTHQPADIIYSFLASLGLKVRIIRTYHGYEGINRNKPGFSYKRRILYFFVNRFVSMNLFVSGDLMEYYRLVNPKQRQVSQRVLYNGVNLNDLSKQGDTKIRVELGISSQSIVFGMLGGFSTRGRDHINVCKALKSVLEEWPEIHFLFIGKIKGNFPELYNNCIDYCKQNNMLRNVHFIGERNDVGSILKELDLYVHSSNHETFGIALVEAMLSEVPCIASDIPPFREVSDNGQYLTLFEKGNANDLSKKIIMELKNLGSIGTKLRISNARVFAEKNFSIQVHMEKLHNLYHECLK